MITKTETIGQTTLYHLIEAMGGKDAAEEFARARRKSLKGYMHFLQVLSLVIERSD